MFIREQRRSFFACHREPNESNYRNANGIDSLTVVRNKQRSALSAPLPFSSSLSLAPLSLFHSPRSFALILFFFFIPRSHRISSPSLSPDVSTVSLVSLYVAPSSFSCVTMCLLFLCLPRLYLVRSLAHARFNSLILQTSPTAPPPSMAASASTHGGDSLAVLPILSPTTACTRVPSLPPVPPPPLSRCTDRSGWR